jgi:hypothetical protein
MIMAYSEVKGASRMSMSRVEDALTSLALSVGKSYVCTTCGSFCQFCKFENNFSY